MSDEQKRPPSLSDLDARLRAFQEAEERGSGAGRRVSGQSSRGMGIAARIGVELVVTTLVGTALGWGLDEWLGTRPWLMIVGVILGGAAAVMNVYRVVQGLDDSVGLGQAIERKKAAERRRNEDGDAPLP